MTPFDGKTLSWKLTGQVFELALHRQPCNEIGSASLEELEEFAVQLKDQASEARVLIIHSHRHLPDIVFLFHGERYIGPQPRSNKNGQGPDWIVADRPEKRRHKCQTGQKPSRGRRALPEF